MTMLAELLRGRGAHVDPVASLERLPWELAGRQVPGHPHTVWQLVGHLNFWMDYELKRIEGQSLAAPTDEALSWPGAAGPADQAAWDRERGLFGRHLDQLVALADAQASTLARIVHRKLGHTVEQVLWLLMAHNSYHVGQIVQLRRALGAWPP